MWVMSNKKPLLDHTAFPFLLTGSLFSLAVLWMLERYIGTLLPSTQRATQTEAIVIWGIWIVLVAIPIATFIWLVRYWMRNRR